MKKLVLLFLLLPVILYAQSIFEVSGPESACAGATITLTSANCSGTIKWSTGATTASITDSPIKTTTYFATCTASGVKTVSSISPIVTPNVLLSSNTGSCFEAGKTTLTAGNAPANSNFKWRKEGVEINGASGATYTPSQSGNYTAELIHEGEWTFQNPVPDGYKLNDIDINANGVGIAVGDFGTIIRTTDSGETWEKVNYSSKNDLHSLHFATNNTIWACGAANTLLRSTDAGLSWSSVSTGQSNYLLIEIFFTDPNHGWVLSNYDGVVLRTSDGGVTWQSSSSGSFNANDIYFTSNTVGWFVGCSGTVKKTTDGGVTWSSISIPNATTSCFQDIVFTTPSNGYVVDYNKIHLTTDGGNTWSTINNLPSYVSDISSISFINSSVGYFTSSVGIFSTTNGGTTWGYAWPNTKLRAVSATSTSTIVAVGEGGTILKKNSANADFSLKNISSINYISDLKFTDDLNGWVVGTDRQTGFGSNGSMHRTKNGGKTWEYVPFSGSVNFQKVDFVDNNNGWIIGNGNQIYRTTDSGGNWTSHNIGTWDYYNYLKFVNTNVGWIGAYNRLLKTVDGGISWNSLTLPAGLGGSYSANFIDNNNGWLGGSNGQLYKTTDGGSSWTTLASGTNQYIREVYFVDSNTGWYSGDGIVRRTTDGGLTWISQLLNIGSYFSLKFSFVNTNEGFARTYATSAGQGSIFYKTTDGGNNWTTDYIPFPYTVQSFDFKSVSKGWMYATPNTVMKYTKLASTCPSNSISLESSPSLNIVSSVTSPIICSGTSVTLTVNGCAAGNTLKWSDGSTGNPLIITAEKAETYTVTCTNPQGCSGSSTYELPVLTTPILTPNSAAPYCAGENVLLQLSGISSQSANWEKDGILFSAAQGKSQFIVNQTGSYTVKNTTSGVFTRQSPNPTYQDFVSVHFPSANVGYAVGFNGAIVKTSDAGTFWQSLESPTTGYITDVHFTSDNSGIILPSYSNSIYKTTDGGNTWQSINLPTYAGWQSITFIDQNTGFLIGSNTVLRTTNGGDSWTQLTLPNTSYINWQSMYFFNNTIGWLCGTNGSILKTMDAGLTWVQQTSGTTNSIRSISFRDANNGFAILNTYSNQLLKTTDGGNSWSIYTNNSIYYGNFASINFTDSNVGYLLNNSYSLYKTIDGGSNWSQIYSLDFYDLRDMQFISATEAYIVGGNGAIFKTTDAWVNWSTFGTRIGSGLNDIEFKTSQKGWIAGSNGLIAKTTDGGKSWVQQNDGPGNYVEDIFFVDENIGFATAYSRVLKTTNGGDQWTSIITPATNSLSKLYFINSTIGWACGSQGRIIKTTDGGNTWISQNSGTNNSLSDIHFINNTTGWAVGYNSTILRTTDGGNSWVTLSAPISSIYSVNFVDANNGWLGGYGLDHLFKTTDGGNTWLPVGIFSNSSYSSVNEIQFFNLNEGVVTYSSGVAITKDGGANWEYIPSSKYVNDMSFVDINTGWALSYAGSISKYNSATTPCVSNSVAVLPSPTKPTVTLNGNEVICEGASVLLTASGCSDTFRWSTGATSSSITVSPPITSSYTALCEKSNGCVTESHIGIGVVNKPIISHSFVNPCQTLYLEADNAAVNGTVEWKKDGTPINNSLIYYNTDELGVYTAKNDQSAAIIPLSGIAINQQLSDVSFFNNIGIATGYNGGILKTTDGGITWIPKKSGTTKQLYRAYLFDENNGWAAGQTLLRTVDGGETWTKISDTYINKLEFINDQVGWAISLYRILKTTDGGITWTQSYGTPNFYNLSGIDVIDAQNIFAVGYQGRAIKSTDGGNSWIELNLNINTSLYDVTFANTTTGWVSGEAGKVYKTTDGGQTWNTATVTSTPNASITIIKASNVNDVWAYSQNNSELSKSTDGGMAWSKVGDRYSMSGYISNFAFRNANTVTAVGMGITNTSNGGSSWQSVNGVNTSEYFQDVYFTTLMVGYAIRSNSVFKTSDGGRNWEPTSIGNSTLTDIQFINTAIGWVIGSNREIFKTTDSGQNWQQVGNFPAQVSSSVWLRKLYFADANNGWVIPNNGGTVLRTIDGGANWTAESTGSFVSLNDIHFYNSTFGIAVGTNNTVLTTSDGGQTWTSRSVGTSAFTYWESVEVVDQNTAWIVTNNSNELYKTTDGGVTWNQVSIASSSYYSIRYLQFLTPQIGFAYGNKIFKTIDGGLNWEETDLYNTGANYFHFANANTGYGVGSTIVKYIAQLPVCAESEPFVFTEARRALVSTKDNITFNPQPSGTLIQGNANYGKIEAANKILNTGTRARYQAKSIDLKPGFLADGQTIFTAEVGGCTNE